MTMIYNACWYLIYYYLQCVCCLYIKLYWKLIKWYFSSEHVILTTLFLVGGCLVNVYKKLLSCLCMFVLLFIYPWLLRHQTFTFTKASVFHFLSLYALNGLFFILHEYCKFTCKISNHLDFRQLDLGFLTSMQYCWLPVLDKLELHT